MDTAAKRALRLVEFNLQVARFAHSSWYEDALGTRLVPSAERCLSTWLLEQLGLREEMDWELDAPQKRLWLLDRAALERLTLELSLAMHREWLALLIDAARLRALYAAIDGEALRFVIEEIPAGCFHCQTPVVSFDTGSSCERVAELKALGARTLIGLLQPSWRAIHGRAQLFFDRALGLADIPPLDAGLCVRALELICERLIPRRFPEWAWCF
jgi:hypothetical protein